MSGVMVSPAPVEVRFEGISVSRSFCGSANVLNVSVYVGGKGKEFSSTPETGGLEKVAKEIVRALGGSPQDSAVAAVMAEIGRLIESIGYPLTSKLAANPSPSIQEGDARLAALERIRVRATDYAALPIDPTHEAMEARARLVTAINDCAALTPTDDKKGGDDARS